MAHEMQEQELRDLFQENLPPVLVPPELAAQLRQRVLAEVDAKLQTPAEESVDLTRPVTEEPFEDPPLPGWTPTPTRKHNPLTGLFSALGERFGSLRPASSIFVAGATVAALVLFVAMLPRLLPGILNTEPQPVAELESLPALDLLEPTAATLTAYDGADAAVAAGEDLVATEAEAETVAEAQAQAAVPQQDEPTTEAVAIALALSPTPIERTPTDTTVTGATTLETRATGTVAPATMATDQTGTNTPSAKPTTESTRVVAMRPTNTMASVTAASVAATRTNEADMADMLPSTAAVTSSASPTPATTANATNTASLQPTATAQRSSGSTPTRTATAASTRSAARTSAATNLFATNTVTPRPSKTPSRAPTATVASTAASAMAASIQKAATSTPRPTATASNTPKPTATSTPRPTRTPLPTSTAVPTETNTPRPPTATATQPVIFVNRPPMPQDDSRRLLEDAPLTIPVLANDSDPDGANPFIVSVDQPQNGSASLSVTGGAIDYAPALDFVGTDEFTYTISDGTLTASATVTIFVNAVNDAPTFALSTERVSAEEDAGVQRTIGLITSMSAGPADEVGQMLHFELTTTDKTLFAELPAIEVASGDLTFTPAADANGTTQVSLVLVDDGGTLNGGVDRTEAQTIVIEISASDDAPSFSLQQREIVVDEDAGAQLAPNVATDISAGAANESGQSLRFELTSDNQSLFAALPAMDATTGDLTFTPGEDAHGEAQVTVVLVDDGGQRSAPEEITIRVNAINDAPSFSLSGGSIEVDEDAGVQRWPSWAISLFAGAANEGGQALTFDLNIDNADLFETLPVIENPSGDLTFTAMPDRHGSATVTALLRDDGGLVSEAKTFALTVHPINDLPQAVDDAFETDQNVTVAGNVLTANPSTPDSSLSDMPVTSMPDSDVDGDALSVTGLNGGSLPEAMPVELPSGAQLTLRGDGSFEYNPNGRFIALPAGSETTDRFTYRLDDGSGQGLQEATVSVVIRGLNDGPVANNHQYQLGDAETLTGNVFVGNGDSPADNDPDGDALVVTAINGVPLTETNVVTLTSGAIVAMQSDGTFVYSRPADATDSVDNTDTTEITDDTFNYRITDPAGASAQGTVTIQRQS